jgi:hypothetical protein
MLPLSIMASTRTLAGENAGLALETGGEDGHQARLQAFETAAHVVPVDGREVEAAVGVGLFPFRAGGQAAGGFGGAFHGLQPAAACLAGAHGHAAFAQFEFRVSK